LLAYLSRSYKQVTFLTFRKRLFPELSEDTLLMLADTKGEFDARFAWKDFEHAGLLRDVPVRSGSVAGARPLDADEMVSGDQRFVEQFLPKRARDLYAALKQASLTARLGKIADVGIGYVTGANSFFHVSERIVREHFLPQRLLKRAVLRGRALQGLRFTEEDWKQSERSYLLHIDPSVELTPGLKRYLDWGIKSGVTEGYKCRNRSPWYKVPHVYQPDAFLSYMSGYTPKLVANDADAVAPNSLHIVRLHPQTRIGRDSLTAMWQTSLTKLSVEIEGHPLGGGMLKLEPTEAENVIVAMPKGAHRLDSLATELDCMVRDGHEREAQERADYAILQRGLGLSASDCALLAQSANTLRDRRTGKGIN
jgi:hypothetical protein